MSADGSASANPSSWASLRASGERHMGRFHSREDVVARPVQNPEDPDETVTRQPLLQAPHDRNAAGDRGFEAEPSTVLAG